MNKPVAVAFEQSENAEAPVPLAGRDDLAHRRAIDRDGVGEPLFATGKTVARKGTLREDNELRPRHRRRLEPVQDLLEVRIEPAELRLHLDGGHAVSRRVVLHVGSSNRSVVRDQWQYRKPLPPLATTSTDNYNTAINQA